jgi:uncharacterized protein DUF3300
MCIRPAGRIVALPLFLIWLLSSGRAEAAVLQAPTQGQLPVPPRAPTQPPAQTQLPAQAAPSAEALDRLLAPIALYPDQLLAQMLQAAQNPGNVEAFRLWLDKNPTLKGTELQDAAVKQGFDPSLVVLALFPQVVKTMSDQLEWTTNIGVAFTADRSAVFASIQRLRKQASDVGTLKTTPQQTVQTKATTSGENVIVIEPANPQVVYVPQYNPTVVYTQPSTTTVVVKEEDNSGEAAALGALVGFTAGIAIGAAMDNDYYYGPYGWHGGCCMYNDAFDDYWDEREDAREDFYDHREDRREDYYENREDLAGERSDRAKNAQEQRTERANGTTQQQRSDRAATAQQQRAERTGSTGTAATQSSTQQRGERATAAQQQRASGGASSTASVQSRGSSSRSSSVDRSGTRSDAFSGYSSGSRERSASSRGSSSRGSRSGGGGRRR